METELREAWVEALLGGEYLQGIGYLNCNGKYCCLGVLCEVAASKGYPVQRHDVDVDPLTGLAATEYGLTGSLDRTTGLLGQEMLELFDLSDVEQQKLAQLNDDGENFEIIAQKIKDGA